MKKSVLTGLCLLFCLLVSCSSPNGDGTDETSPPPAETTAQTAAALPVPEGPDVSRLTDYSWYVSSPSATGALTFDGDTATFELYEDGADKTVSGPVSFTEKTMTIGDTKIKWAVVASFCKLTVGDVSYSLLKADDPASARAPFELLNNTWSGDGLTLSFDDDVASLSLEGGQSWTGSYELTGGKTLTIHDDSKEGPTVNLAKGAAVTASSVETEDFPPEYAADGDLGTRWSSAYVDPSWLLLDLGEEKTVGAAVVYFETACSADFTFEVSSDGKKFEEAAEVTGNSAAGTESPVTVTFPEAKRARYVRFNGLSRATQWGHSIYELELYGIIPGEAVCALAFDGGRIDLTLRGNTYSLSKAN